MLVNVAIFSTLTALGVGYLPAGVATAVVTMANFLHFLRLARQVVAAVLTNIIFFLPERVEPRSDGATLTRVGLAAMETSRRSCEHRYRSTWSAPSETTRTRELRPAGAAPP